MDSYDILTKETILAALRRLDELLREQGVMGEICIFGGAAMVLAFDARESTRDVDAVFVPKDKVLDCARQVSKEFDIDEDWMNNGVKGFISDKAEVTHEGMPVFENLRIMRPTVTRRTFADSLRNVKQQDDFDYALANFLDRFKKDPDLDMVKEEPPILREILNDNGLTDSFAAAAAAHLCQLHDLPFPDWVNKPSRRMKDPWFAAKSHNLRMVLLQESPAAFRVRNLFVSANALHRA